MSSSRMREEFIAHLQHSPVSPHIQADIATQNNYSVTSEQQERITNHSLTTHLSECGKTCRSHSPVKNSSCSFRRCMVSQVPDFAHCSTREHCVEYLH
ncbi:hypothetical protein K503DRAFT_174256 [Rhizopogon vinicolor AM-OR11-026]|uniref:Uncharacterized protein n=1 Tax=Rhizopogon vinicolor AM-OR11-026 TaxID=1314800 RepID=A0A1B7N078_9AGAM|nr:hypothetical protein K503DRAFT_174256 [Rhizopogon vinicolor AM-OR11-026]